VLDELRITKLGVIDEAILPLGPGLTVVTGETGAGKTMVVTGLLLLFGGRADPARVRGGSSQAVVDGRLLLPADSAVVERARDAGGELDPAGDRRVELTLRRTVQSGGRSRAYVGGAPTPVAVLGELADELVAVHGQADQLRLIRPASQRDALDRYADLDRAEYAAAFAAWRAAQARLDERTSRAAELRREADLLAYGVAEIEAVAPEPGEDDELRRLAGRLGHAEALQTAARAAHDSLLGGAEDFAAAPSDVAAVVAGVARQLRAVADADPELDALAGRLTELGNLAADLGADFGSYADQLETDPARLAAVEDRRGALTALVRKYCDDPEPSLAGVLGWADRARARLTDLDVSDEAMAALRAERDSAAALAAELATAVSAARQAAASSLASAVNAELPGLALPDAELEISVQLRPVAANMPTLSLRGQEAGATSDGVDDVVFRFRSHPGAPMLALGRGASGGELSRLMLAVEVALASADPLPTMVFDEVDAGVGGRAAVEVGRRLARLAEHRQVLVVTHLAQVAAFADQHVVVRKDAPNGTEAGSADPAGRGAVTASDVRIVAGAERTAELARMLGGSSTATARRHAAELLADAARASTG
jgi:DNA repair protein RecN (Recombination protein N)